MAGRRGGRTKLVRRLQVAARYPGVGVLLIPSYLGIGNFRMARYPGIGLLWVPKYLGIGKYILSTLVLGCLLCLGFWGCFCVQVVGISKELPCCWGV